MLSREFTTREKILLLILAVILLAELYYLLVHQKVERDFAEARERMETAMVFYDIESAKAAKKQEMLEKIQEATEDGSVRPLPDYDNATNVVAYMNGVMESVEEYNLVFNNVDFRDYVAMRSINMSFNGQGYSAVKNIVTLLEDGPYYCEVTGLSMSTENEISDMTDEMVSGQIAAAFYEYAGDRMGEESSVSGSGNEGDGTP